MMTSPYCAWCFLISYHTQTFLWLHISHFSLPLSKITWKTRGDQVSFYQSFISYRTWIFLSFPLPALLSLILKKIQFTEVCTEAVLFSIYPHSVHKVTPFLLSHKCSGWCCHNATWSSRRYTRQVLIVVVWLSEWYGMYEIFDVPLSFVFYQFEMIIIEP